MKFIGITGGVGAGKSAILNHLSSKENTRVMLADEIAHELMKPGSECYDKLREVFKDEPVWRGDATFDRNALAKVIFSDECKRENLNKIVHPAVKDYVRKQKEEELLSGDVSLLVLEAALLIEEHYDEICDQLWYIYTSEENRRARLKKQRGYSDEKIDSIFSSQLSEETYRAHCSVVIDNNGDIKQTIEQIEAALLQ